MRKISRILKLLLFLRKEVLKLAEENQLKTEDGYELGTFHFLKAGWWIWHIIAIVGVFWLGYLYGGSVF